MKISKAFLSPEITFHHHPISMDILLITRMTKINLHTYQTHLQSSIQFIIGAVEEYRPFTRYPYFSYKIKTSRHLTFAHKIIPTTVRKLFLR